MVVEEDYENDNIHITYKTPLIDESYFDEYDSFKYISRKRWEEYIDKYILDSIDEYESILKTLLENN